jgi:hypothetical protein
MSGLVKVYYFRWHRRAQIDIALGRGVRFGFLSLGWTWRKDGFRPILYWSPDAVGLNPRAVGPWRTIGY